MTRHGAPLSRDPGPPPRGRSDLLALGFGTSVAMWAAAYVARLPGIESPGWLLMAVLLALLLAGGWAAARLAGGGWRLGAAAGLIAGAVNLLILGSLLGGERPGEVVPGALWWLPGSLLVGAALGAAGAAAGATGRRSRSRRSRRSRPPAPPLWRLGPAALARVAAAATFLLIVAGGIVTSKEAGLAVVDWPNSFGYNMFLYPLGRMTGDVYYEHGHRLLGTLVGLTVLVLAVHLQRVEPRPWVRRLGWGALAAVVAQGVLGGLRVTGRLTLADSPDLVSPNLSLAVVHGILGQIVFGLVIALAVVTGPRWRAAEPAALPGGSPGRSLGRAALAVLVGQVALGAVLRHLEGGLHLHIMLGILVGLLVVATAVRLWGRQQEAASLASRSGPRRRQGPRGVAPAPRPGRLATAATVAAAVQILLGLGALIATGLARPAAGPHPADVLLATAHQAGGAVLLAILLALVLWVERLAAPAPARAAAPAPERP